MGEIDPAQQHAASEQDFPTSALLGCTLLTAGFIKGRHCSFRGRVFQGNERRDTVEALLSSCS
jgi:hypothetical protein